MKRLLTTIAILTALATVAVAQGFDNLPDPVEDVNKVVDNTPDSIAKALMSRPAPGSTRVNANPVLFLIGNSTMRNGTKGDGANGQWGWGYYANQYFNGRMISVENQALGGMSTRTYYNQLWPAVREVLKPGDWVIISIGHNDNGPYDSGRARAVIPGTGTDSIAVTIKETGVQETVYSYGGYLRKYIADCRAKGAHPILMSLTPRDAYDEQGKIVRKPQGKWLEEIAQEQGVPYVDLNEISGRKLDRYGTWKAHYHFYGDKIHTSKWGAEMNARSAAEGIMENSDPQLQPLKAMMINVELPIVQFKREAGKPVVFFTGDSTVKNADKAEDGMWGWASQAFTVFDENKVTLVNAARAGRSTRTFLKEGLWDKVYNALQPGDFVTIQFGHNDICPITDRKARGVIASSADTSRVYKLDDGSYEVVYSFGWYLKKFIRDVREKGATPILVSLTPRNEWPGGKVERRDKSYGQWYRDVVKETGVEFVDMHNISADFLDKKFAKKKMPTDKEQAKAAIAQCKEKAGVYFKKDHTHASLLGARMNAQSMAKGLRANKSALAGYLK
jgi:lysophospholipase L1-like esterase